MIDLSIIVINYNTKRLTAECVSSIGKHTKGMRYEIIIVDNASKDGSAAYFRKRLKSPNVSLVENAENMGFAKANNQGMKRAKGKYILLLNSDTYFEDNFLANLVAWMEKNPRVAVSSCALKNKDGSLQGTGGHFPTLFKVFAWMFFVEDIPLLDKIIKPFHPMHVKSPLYKGQKNFENPGERDWVTGAFFLLRSTILKNVGYFDEDYFMYVEEVDYCYRIKKAGWKVWYLPQWHIVHLGGASSTKEFPIISEYMGIKLFYRKHMPKWQNLIMRLFLKSGALLRSVMYGLLEGRASAQIYVKAFRAV